MNRNILRPQVREIYPGIFMLRLPLIGKGPGPVNIYLFKGKRNVLLDTGPKQTVTLLENSLRDIGLSLADIDSIILTHGHPDHYGSAYRISKQSKAVVKVHEDDKRLVETGSDVPASKSWEFLEIAGVPVYFKASARVINFMINQLADNCEIGQVLQDGDRLIMGNYTGTVLSTPGHSKGSVCIYIEEKNIVFSGDHLLEHITPNPLVMLDNSNLLPQRQSQLEFYSSINKIEQLKPNVIYPGHGRAITDLSFTVNKYKSQFKKRQKHILSIISSGEYTVYEIARKVFPDLRGLELGFNIFLSVSEVFTHLQVLEKDKKAVSYFKDGHIIFRAV